MGETARAPKAVQAGQGRTIFALGERVTLKATGEDTQGGFAVVEVSTPPQVGPPLHLHHREDEGLYVLEGMYEVRVGGRTVPAPPGTSVILPREIPHTHANVGYRTGRLLLTITPAGFEGFFDELSQLAPGTMPDCEQLARIGEKYGFEILSCHASPSS